MLITFSAVVTGAKTFTAIGHVLSAAMGEITRELAPGSVDVRLRGLHLDSVGPPPADGGPTKSAAPVEPLKAQAPAEGDEGGTARVDLSLPAHLKACRDGRQGPRRTSWPDSAPAPRRPWPYGSRPAARPGGSSASAAATASRPPPQAVRNNPSPPSTPHVQHKCQLSA
ncbi:hypothetical protein [Streptomyces hirsutus]|uniref:hypothetical protein n=1 Tax=Streptomyces hirsutus TaxID=35620 RepID=UPI003D15FAAD